MKPILTEKEFPIKAHSRRIAPDEFLTTSELMRLLKIKHKQTVYGLIQEGLPAILVGKNYRFIKNDVVNFLKSHFLKRRKANWKNSRWKNEEEDSFNRWRFAGP